MKPTLKHNPLDRLSDRGLETALILAIAFIWNAAVYLGGRLIASAWYHYDMTLPIDGLVPFLPWTVCIYLGSYLFWAANYCICARKSGPERDRFFSADFLSRCVCLLFFVLLPTTNVRPDVEFNSVWDWFMALVYMVDSADNLFPSIHCLVSWFCWIGVRKRKDIPLAYRCFSFLAAAAICISTLTTRQHVLVDTVGGVALAEICYWIARRPRISAVYSDAIRRLMGYLRRQERA